MQLELAAGDESWERVRPLEDAVYTPEVLAAVPWRDVVWANAERRVLVNEDGTLVAHVGLYLRDALLDGAPVRIGGIGGVMTHPSRRRHGLATAALRRALTFFAEQRVDIALLFCEPKMFPLYEALGFRGFDGDILVEQPGGKVRFTLTRTMTQGIALATPTAGIIDLCGLPW
jgi:aminoglycoside 2'-N-acetyltransferase I